MTDYLTSNYYRDRVEDVFSRYESVASPLAEVVDLAFRKEGVVLDIG